MKKVNLEGFNMIGISVRTTNMHGQAAQDIPALCAKFQEEHDLHGSEKKISDEVICAYTDYEGDHNTPYTVVLGYKVNDFNEIPSAYTTLKVPGGSYENYVAKGDLIGGAIVEKWHEIWEQSMHRNYIVDFELYGEKAKDPRNGSCDIFISVQ